jgi:hypothetical protein
MISGKSPVCKTYFGGFEKILYNQLLNFNFRGEQTIFKQHLGKINGLGLANCVVDTSESDFMQQINANRRNTIGLQWVGALISTGITASA